ncbi:hypothetical protein ACA910_010242 [Epithemia clementina (nom. ined.)]
MDSRSPDATAAAAAVPPTTVAPVKNNHPDHRATADTIHFTRSHNPVPGAQIPFFTARPAPATAAAAVGQEDRPPPPQYHHHYHQDLFSRPTTTTTTMTNHPTRELMGPILRRKKVVSLPLGAGGDFFYSSSSGGNPPGGRQEQLFLDTHHETNKNHKAGEPTTPQHHHPQRRKQKSEGVPHSIASATTTTMSSSFFETPNKDGGLATAMTAQSSSSRIRQKTPPSTGTSRPPPSRTKQVSGGGGGTRGFVQGVVRRKQVSLDLLGPNDFFAAPPDDDEEEEDPGTAVVVVRPERDEVLHDEPDEPEELEKQGGGEDHEGAGKEDLAVPQKTKKTQHTRLFRPLRFSTPLAVVGRHKNGGHGGGGGDDGGHGGGAAGGHAGESHQLTHGHGLYTLNTIDEEVTQAFQRYSAATVELESTVASIHQVLEAEEDNKNDNNNDSSNNNKDKDNNNNIHSLTKSESLRDLRASLTKAAAARQAEEGFLRSKLNLVEQSTSLSSSVSSRYKDEPDNWDEDAAGADFEKKDTAALLVDDPAASKKQQQQQQQQDDINSGIIRATRSDRIKAGICFVIMLALTIVMTTWNTHMDEESFLITPVGLACLTDCYGNTETRNFFAGGQDTLANGEVLRLLIHVDANEEAALNELGLLCQIVGQETQQVKAVVHFPPPDAEDRETHEERVTVKHWNNASEPHVVNVLNDNGGDLPLGFTLQVKVLTPLAQQSEVVAALIMFVVYLLILLEVIHRTLVAVLGSMVALLFVFIMDGGETESIQHIMLNLEWSTLGLLFGMMLLVGELSHTGIFEYCAVRLLMASKGSFVRLIVLLGVLTAVASAFLDNVTTMLLVAPVTIDMCNILNVDPRPYLIAEVLLSNIGGTATMIGDPPNIIIGSSFEDIGFVDFITNVLPAIFLFCIPVALVLIVWIYRYYLTTDDMKVLDTYKLKQTYPIYDEPRLMIAGTVTLFVIIMFFLHPIHHKDTAWIALLGAFVTICFTNPHDVQDALRNHVEWDTLLFFAGLFVLVEACAAMGLLSLIGEALATYISGEPEDKQLGLAITLIIWVSAITSAFLDNIPYTATMIPVIEIMADELESLDLVTLAWALSFGACLGGNGTLLGASANIVTAGISATRGYEISFLNFLYPGMVVMIATVAIANLYMLVRYAWL